MSTKGLRNVAIVAFVVSMAVLLGGGFLAFDKAPPIPEKVVVVPEAGELASSSQGDETAVGATGGRSAAISSEEASGTSRTGKAPESGSTAVLAPPLSGESIRRGQQVYQRYGLMNHGSVWGHGSLRGMDFSAYTLHALAAMMKEYYAAGGRPSQAASETLPPLPSRQIDDLDLKVLREFRANRYEPATGALRLTPAQAFAAVQMRRYWDRTFGQGDPRYGFLPGTIPTPEERRDLADFFFWTAWAAGTERPGLSYTYTNNWPADRQVGNTPSTETVLWSVLSILALFAVLGVVVYIVHRYEFFYGESKAVEAAQAFLQSPVTASQRAAAKFFLVAGLLFVAQILMGGLLAHYTVHPGSFYLQAIAELIPYSWAKTWHLQLAILWIAVSWIGTAVYLAPLMTGREPAGQRLLVNILFAAAVLVAVGSLLGEALGIKGYLGDAWYWLGHQGWEYLELGRLWQILLFGGLIFWLVIVYRAILPVLSRPKTPEQEVYDRRSLTIFYVLSAIFVVAFFGFGLFYHRGTHITIADYWRWFVVHIWVESIFEFFGVAVISLFLVSLGLVSATSALRVAYLTAILVFVSGIPGTAHHYFWYGGPSFWLAVGGVFSSVEPVPLILLVVRAWMEYRSIRAAGQKFPYRWPLYFLTASSVWNFVGAGLFGFLINLPIINYYEHGTYLTSNHGHTALFGVYGMLAIALILFCWRGLVEDRYWNDRLLAISFWGLNGGLVLMALTGLLPIGLYQLWYSYEYGLWWARSAAFYELPIIQTLGNWRIVPDAIIIVPGALPLLYFLLSTYPRLRR